MPSTSIVIKKHNDTLWLHAAHGQCPVGIFYAQLKINGSPFHARFSLGDGSRPIYSDCPFEEILVSLDRKQVSIKGSSVLQDEKRGDRIQGVILALVPAPKGGNQYVVIFINQKSLQKGKINCYSGVNDDIYTIYRSLAAIMGDEGWTLLEKSQDDNQ